MMFTFLSSVDLSGLDDNLFRSTPELPALFSVTDNGAVTAPGVDFHSTYAHKAPPTLTATTDL